MWHSIQNRTVRICKSERFNITINFDDVTGENMQKRNLHRPQIPGHPCRIRIVGGSGSGCV